MNLPDRKYPPVIVSQLRVVVHLMQCVCEDGVEEVRLPHLNYLPTDKGILPYHGPLRGYNH